MKPLDRLILLLIAAGLFANAFAPLIVGARGNYQDVNIAAVGGYEVRGGTLPTK